MAVIIAVIKLDYLEDREVAKQMVLKRQVAVEHRLTLTLLRAGMAVTKITGYDCVATKLTMYLRYLSNGLANTPPSPPPRHSYRH
jgi:hypothetical protein